MYLMYLLLQIVNLMLSVRIIIFTSENRKLTFSEREKRKDTQWILVNLIAMTSCLILSIEFANGIAAQVDILLTVFWVILAIVINCSYFEYK